MLAFVFKSPCIHFSQCFILPFPPSYLRRWLNADYVDGFLLCNNQSNEGKRIFRGLKRLKSTVFTFHMKASVLERREVCHLQGTFMCRSSVSWMTCMLYEFALAVGQKERRKKKMVQLQFWWFFVFLLELKDFVRLRGLRILSDQWAWF